jgi:hypothetical protein
MPVDDILDIDICGDIDCVHFITIEFFLMEVGAP